MPRHGRHGATSTPASLPHILTLTPPSPHALSAMQVVPLRTAHRHFVHHLTDKYTRRTDVTMAKPDTFFRAAANFSSRPITLLGARRRRPARKLEVELRERGSAGTAR